MLFISAVSEELGPLPGGAVGVGPVESALGIARFIAQRSPACVVWVGTAGAYPDGPAIGAVVAARRVGWAHGVATMGWGYVPRHPPVLLTDATLRQRIALPEADAVTVGAISTAPELVAALGADWSVETMEAWSVARACEAAGIPFAAILGVTNEVGPQAHAQWLANRQVVEAAVRAAAARLLESTGPLPVPPSGDTTG